MRKDEILEYLNRDKKRLMGSLNYGLGHQQPTRKEAEFLSFPFKVVQPDRATFVRKYRAFAEMMIRFLIDEKITAVTSIQIIPLEEPDYIKYRLDVTL